MPVTLLLKSYDFIVSVSHARAGDDDGDSGESQHRSVPREMPLEILQHLPDLGEEPARHKDRSFPSESQGVSPHSTGLPKNLRVAPGAAPDMSQQHSQITLCAGRAG